MPWHDRAVMSVWGWQQGQSAIEPFIHSFYSPRPASVHSTNSTAASCPSSSSTTTMKILKQRLCFNHSHLDVEDTKVLPDNWIRDIELKQKGLPKLLWAMPPAIQVSPEMKSYYDDMREFYKRVGVDPINLHTLREKQVDLTKLRFDPAIRYLLEEVKTPEAMFDLVYSGLFYLNNKRPFYYVAICMEFLDVDDQMELRQLVVNALKNSKDYKSLLRDFPKVDRKSAQEFYDLYKV